MAINWLCSVDGDGVGAKVLSQLATCERIRCRWENWEWIETGLGIHTVEIDLTAAIGNIPLFNITLNILHSKFVC